MSLIAQAAKRLEELRRAGVHGGKVAVDERASPDSAHTPEAVVRALDAARSVPVTVPDSAGAAAANAAAAATPNDAAAGSTDHAELSPRGTPTRGTSASRTVRIDVEGLKARGYLTPDVPRSWLGDELRVIKRPIIKNALARAGAGAKNGNLVMVTSAMPAEGKTFMAVNLAMSVAMELDNTVLLVDGDVANAALPRLLGIPEGPGLFDLLTDDKLEVSDALVRTNVERLSILPAGTFHRSATELLASEQMKLLLSDLATRSPDRTIIFDSPPLLATTEARVLASHMGQIVVVVAAESTSQNTVRQALATIESCENVMMVLNKAGSTDVSEYGTYPVSGPR